MVQHARVLWAFWIACGLAAVAGSAALLFAGPSSRIAGAIIPFAVAAVALGGCAVLHQQGRPIATALYFIAGLAIVYAILALIAVPLRLAVIGTCPPEPARCAIGFEQPLTSGESTGMGFAIGMGIVSVLTGFFGLVTLYRRSATKHAVERSSSSPPVRRIAPVGSSAAARTQEKPVEPATPAAPAAVAATSAPEPAAAPPEPQLELAAPAQELELPAHEEALELPPPEPAVPQVDSARAPKPRRRRTPKAAPDQKPPPGTN